MTMPAAPGIAVLLPTYNGARFLKEQLDSLLSQTMQEFVIISRDDGSTDETKAIVQTYSQKIPGRLHVLEDGLGNLGASGNFAQLMQYVIDRGKGLGLENAYMMFCDQDDVWEQNKMEVERNLMHKLESQFPGIPLLVHSDLTVINDDESLIAESFINYQGLNAEKNDLRNITFSNTVTGCTALFNQQLVQKALPVPDTAMMHDWWLAMVAAAFGRIEFEPRCLVRYRQHSQNTLGATEFIPRKVFSRTTLRQLFRRNRDDLLRAVAAQAESFVNRYGEEIPVRERARLRLASRLRTDSFLIQRILFRLLRFQARTSE